MAAILRLAVLWLWCSLLCFAAQAQTSNLRCRRIAAQSGIIPGDSLLIYAPSLSLSDSGFRVTYNARLNVLMLSQSGPVRPGPDSIRLCYRVLQVPHRPLWFLRDPRVYDTAQYYYVPPSSPSAADRPNREEVFSSPGLQKSGSLSRGISFGNRQSVFVNSQLNLQLEGRLAEGVTLSAAITDQNVPYQPEGNTQTLREFDRVYITLASRQARLTAGDITLASQTHPFLRYYKNVQGAQGLLRQGNDTVGSTTAVSAAIAKGKFASVQVPVQEGVQGPYRLRPPGNEAFIIITANSERVFLDGRQLKRGYNLDYVIDYNTGELTLNNNIIITRFSRLRVDFEYAERNYNRTILQAGHHQNYKKWSLDLHHYQEADNAYRPLSFQLDDQVLNYLRNIKDSVDRAFINGASRADEFSEDQLLYRRIDSLGDSIYIYTPVNRPPLYRVFFTFVGAGQGDYDPIDNLANGRIFRWKGRGQGSYLPVRRVALPNKRQVSTIGGGFKDARIGQFDASLALSQYNVNRYAGTEAQQNGSAQRLAYATPLFKLGADHQLSSGVFYERLDKEFTGIDRFRPIEFERDWSAPTADSARAEDHLINWRTELQGPRSRGFYNLARRNKAGFVNGWQQNAQLGHRTRLLDLGGTFFLMNNDNPGYISNWLRGSGTARLLTPLLQPGYTYSTDRNVLLAPGSRQVISSAMFYDEQTVSLRTADSSKNSLEGGYTWRTDQLPVEGRMAPAYFSRTASLGGRIVSIPLQTINILATYRKQNTRTELSNAQQEQTVMGRVDWAGGFLQQHLRQEISLATATGQELRREYRFVKIAALGQGTHQWIDYNQDGVPQLDEFVEAARPEDRQYIKVFVPTNDYVKAYSTNANYRINLEGPRGWRGRKGFFWLTSRLSNATALALERRVSSPDLGERLNPFLSVNNARLLSERSSFRTQLFFNRADPNYGADVTLGQTFFKSLLTDGFESRKAQEWKGSLRSAFLTEFNAQLLAGQRTTINQSDFLLLRNYHLNQGELGPLLAWQPQNSLRIQTGYFYSIRNNTAGAEAANVHRIELETRLSKVGTRTVLATLRYYSIAAQGPTNTPASYELLEALRPGRNLVLSLNWQQKLVNGLQLQLNYEGRRSPGLPVVHIGQVSVTALF